MNDDQIRALDNELQRRGAQGFAAYFLNDDSSDEDTVDDDFKQWLFDNPERVRGAGADQLATFLDVFMLWRARQDLREMGPEPFLNRWHNDAVAAYWRALVFNDETISWELEPFRRPTAPSGPAGPSTG